MKIPNVPGEFAFPALLRFGSGWRLSDAVYFTLAEAQECNRQEVRWPVEDQGNEIYYVPSAEELV